ncbi:15-hydroxyprostaglandin dehydrogenase [NAD(+)]-like isoform X2 [Littorina saxatilis]|uniref:15-hydroxyprostaglandin dehydrogenase [NAD(+)] n=1 Tax=Littorina saxatilis TaxID=31220 RepID=A0AAN9BXS7_9CAEN
MKVDGKGALVTGGAQGLGKAFSKILLQNGAKVFFTDINEEVGKTTLTEFQQTYGQNNVRFFKADVTSTAQMKESFDMAKSWLGGLHVVVNNAGIGGEGDDMWEKLIDINLKGPIRCSRLAVDYMRRDKGGEGGVIVNIASTGGLRPNPYGPVYSGSKAGLIMYSRSIAANQEYTSNGVRVCTLCPSFADTALVANISKGTTTNTEAALALVNQVGIMTVEEVADCLHELVTDDSKNGAVLAVSKHQGKTYVPF